MLETPVDDFFYNVRSATSGCKLIENIQKGGPPLPSAPESED
jgi:hypothetical protein